MEELDPQVVEIATARVRSFLTIEISALLSRDVSLLDAITITYNHLIDDNKMAACGEVLDPEDCFDEVLRRVVELRVEFYDLSEKDKDLFSHFPTMRAAIGQRVFIAALQVIIRDVLGEAD